MRRYIKADYDATLPQDMLFNPDGGENAIRDYYRQKGAEDKKAREDAEVREAHEKAVAELKEKYPESKINELREMTGSIDDILDAAFDFLVPPSGKCDSVAGELVRAVMRVIYRDFNDGDVFYEGYGRETCLPSVAYIIEQFPDMFDEFDEIATDKLKEDEYTLRIETIADEILDKIFSSDSDLYFWAPNSADSLASDISRYDDWEPHDYTYDGDFPDALIEAMFDDKVSQAEVEMSVQDALAWEDIQYEYLTVGEYGWSVEGLTLDDYERLQDMGDGIGSFVEDDLEIANLYEDDEDEDDDY